MRRANAISFLAILILFCLSAVMACGQTRANSSSVPAGSRRKQEGFFDYALGKINPNGNDYGARIQGGRNAIVVHTVDDLYFWSNVVTLLLLTGVSAVILLQWRASDKKEIIAASLIAELWNGRVSDRIEIKRRTDQFNRLVETHNTEVERMLTEKSQPRTGEEQAVSELKRTVEGMDKRRTNLSAQVQEGAANRSTAVLSGGKNEGATGTGLQQRNVMLERQVEAMRNTEANLRRRLNDTMAQLEQERNRNQTLKGA